MAIYPIKKIGDPVLRAKAREVSKVTDQTRKLIEDMFDTMYDAPGVGLAAPQVGISQRIIVIDVDDNPIALVNPEIIEARGTQLGEEGCLSIPNDRAKVERSAFVRVRGLNPEGREVEIAGDDLLARALQHEIDHLEGILFTDKKVSEKAESEE